MDAIKIEILNRIKQEVHLIEPRAKIILFGSRARGEERADSDWDILILIPEGASLRKEQEFRHALFDLELDFGQSFSTFVYSFSDWENNLRVTPLYHNIQQEGYVL
jgi:predicted nucleotidyltransferase